MSDFWYGFRKQALLRPDVELQDQQTRVKKKLDRSGGLLVYHGLGSGKTLTAINATQGGKTDVVVPASLRNNFRKEVSKYTTGYHPNIMSYEKAIKSEPQGDNLIIDEAHSMGRHDSKRSQILQQQALSYKKRLLLTATPLRNHPSEIAPLLRAVRGDKSVPLDPKTFNEQFIAEERHNPGFFARVFKGAQPGVTYRMKNRAKFQGLVDGYVDYHAPSAKDFPSVSHEVLESPMDTEQKKYYDFVMGKAGPALRYKIKSGLPPSKSEAKSLNTFLTGVRQVSNSTKAYGGNGVSPKINLAMSELVKRHDVDPNFKALIYSNYLDSGVGAYSDELKRKGIPHGIFDGSLSDKKRKELVDAYNEDKLKALLITGAGSQGLDLKGTKLVQLLEPSWNETRLAQATGRAVRYKSHAHLPESERHVHIQRLHATNPRSAFDKLLGNKADLSVDQYLDMLSKDKEKLNNAFLDVLREVGQKH